MVGRVDASGQADARRAADLQSIATALEAYKTGPRRHTRGPTGRRTSGFAVLGQALIAPYGDGDESRRRRLRRPDDPPARRRPARRQAAATSACVAAGHDVSRRGDTDQPRAAGTPTELGRSSTVTTAWTAPASDVAGRQAVRPVPPAARSVDPRLAMLDREGQPDPLLPERPGVAERATGAPTLRLRRQPIDGIVPTDVQRRRQHDVLHAAPTTSITANAAPASDAGDDGN